jgi:hypothetical protein
MGRLDEAITEDQSVHIRKLIIAVVVGLSACSQTLAQESDAPKLPEQSELLKLALPGPEHEQLARYPGKWRLTVTTGSGAAAKATHYRADARMIAGGRFLQIEYSGAERAADGIFCIGFDRRHQRFALVAIDSYGTYFVTSQGKRDEATRTLKLYGKDDDPVMKSLGHTKEFIHILDFRNDDEFVIEVWFVDTRTPQRREIKFMAYKFNRDK